jgi:hopanoid biosynthesis associated protein HpnK
VRRLIVNADDFGVTRGVNRAIVEANEQGIVTSATLMANSRAFDSAVERAQTLAQRGARFSVGCHVVLVDGEPLSPAERIPTLLERTGAPQFREQLSSFALAAVTGRIAERELEYEAAAQIARIQKAGITISHVDTHKHTHMFPAVLRPLLRAAREHGVKAVRNPFEPVLPLPVRRIVRNPKLCKRFAQMAALRSFAPAFRREVAAHGLRTTDGCLGVLVTGVLDLGLFAQIASAIPDGTWEFVCHPGYNDTDLDRVRTRLRGSRQNELEVLTSREAKEALQRRGVELISYQEL